jgi:two-component system response regulator VanR
MEEIRKGTDKSTDSKAGQTISGRILVAEDNKTTQDLVSRFLEYLGFEVALACDGIEALALFIKGSFDLVLIDLQMPAMDGLSLARHIKERSPGTPVLLLTGSDREMVRKNVERVHVESVIFKPFRLEDLQREVQGALAPRQQEHGSVEVGSRPGSSPKGAKSRKDF